jgi:hypothetical protein
LNKLQQIVFYRRYDKDLPDKENPRAGWTVALTIQDLSRILHAPLPVHPSKLVFVCKENWSNLGDSQSNVDAVLGAIDDMRKETLQLIKSLE